MKKIKYLLSSLYLGLVAFVPAFSMSASAASTNVYDALPSPLPPNYVSLGFQATSTAELADEINLANTEGNLDTITVGMSTWAKYSEYTTDVRYTAAGWTHPITVTVYGTELDGDGQPTTVLASKTVEVAMPWRAESDPTCSGGTAWRASDNNCYNGLAFSFDADFSSMNVDLPNEVIVGVAYNTQTYGADPLGVAGPYNSLNVGVPADQVATVGSDEDNNALFWDTTYPGYTPGLREDTGWTSGSSQVGTMALEISVNTTPDLSTLTSKDQCKKDGWKSFEVFKNQGDCVSYVASNKKNKPTF